MNNEKTYTIVISVQIYLFKEFDTYVMRIVFTRNNNQTLLIW